MRLRILLIWLALLGAAWDPRAQDLMDLLEENEAPVVEYTKAIFKTTRIVIGQSIETPPKGNALFLVTHHFGRINSGYQNLFGLNQAFIRLGLEYGVNDWLGMGVGISTYQITWDGFIKARLLRQSKGARRMPLGLNLFASISMKTNKWEDPERTNYFSSRLSYAFQLQIARRFGERVKLSKRVSVNAEYHYVLPGQIQAKSPVYLLL